MICEPCGLTFNAALVSNFAPFHAHIDIRNRHISWLHRPQSEKTYDQHHGHEAQHQRMPTDFPELS